LLGLLGTVTGMIRTFKAITVAGVGNPSAMASGIAEALITTATGLIIAIPALVAYRMLRSRVDGHVIDMEKESLKLVQAIDRAGALRPASAAGIGAALSSPADAQEAVA
jgi:biopolymer transport protein ExbB